MSVIHPRNFNDVISGVALAAGAANVIMQLSMPGIGHGVAESKVDSGNVTKHPFKRMRTTFTYLAVAAYGSDTEKLAYRKAVNAAHRQVRSTEDSPVDYNAFDTGLQLWVAACLYKGSEDVHNALYPRARYRGQNGLYEMSRVLGTTLQMREEQWPKTRDDFQTYWDEQLTKVHIDDRVREYLMQLVDLTMLPAPIAFATRPFHRFLTTGFLEPAFRKQMHLSWSRADQRAFDLLFFSIGMFNRHLPTPVRAFPLNAYLYDFRQRVRSGKALV
ncbi:MAG: oxygenase MpaB family protein [Microthrixaceae bacterium]